MQDIGFDLNSMSFAVLFVAFALGGVIKGATGAGAPVIAIPVMALFFDVQLAVILMAIPNLISNSVQIVHYRNENFSKVLVGRFAAFGALGCSLGTVILAFSPPNLLEVIVAVSTVSYIALRIMNPKLELKEKISQKLSIPIGFAGGVIQGASGISAPIALSFLTAMKLKREVFIFTISCFFGGMALVQIGALSVFGLLKWPLILLSIMALIPQIMFMPVGNLITKNMQKTTFDKVILALLSILCFKLIYNIIY
jgi:uncharacterized protein